ncbi:acylphosphatase [Halomonas venusta]|uniref:acylphosphatase n=1 Tax=Vreelandella venusta TaxID=44935 RepID=UPI00295ED23A|nr:acylphosphatase [Halomonas venusta]MDW0359741.1 acylphosphatase [Halomonas venusta]
MTNSVVLPYYDHNQSLNSYTDDFSDLARNAHETHLLGPWLIARVAESEGAEVTWFSRAIFLATLNEVQVLFWDVRANEAAVGAKIATHKLFTHRFLDRADVPKPRYSVVYSVQGAMKFAAKVGGAVVVKPIKGTRGRGVAIGLKSEEEIKIAYEQAKSSIGVLVEEQVKGTEYRFFVLGGEVLSVLGKKPAHVVGDGILSVSELVDAKNKLRALNPRLMTSLIPKDDVVEQNLAKQELAWESIPAKEQEVLLRHEANISMGADTFDATDSVPEVAKQAAIDAVAAIPGLDWAGVDVIVDSSDKLSPAAYIIEVNTGPGIGGHHFPMLGTPRDLATPLWRRAYEKQKALGGQFSIAPIQASLPAPCQRLVSIEGKVQKVGFRRWLRREATALNIQGWVRNHQDGTVRAVLKGDLAKVEQLLGKIHFGPKTASVERVSVTPHSRSFAHSGFIILKPR